MNSNPFDEPQRDAQGIAQEETEQHEAKAPGSYFHDSSRGHAELRRVENFSSGAPLLGFWRAGRGLAGAGQKAHH